MAGVSPESLPFYDAVGSPPALPPTDVEAVDDAALSSVNVQDQHCGRPVSPPKPLRSAVPAPSIQPSINAVDEEDGHIDPFMFNIAHRSTCHRRSPSLPTPSPADLSLPAGRGRPALRLHARARSYSGAWQGTPPPTTPLPPLPLLSPTTEGPLDGLLFDHTPDIAHLPSSYPATPIPRIAALFAHGPVAPSTARVLTTTARVLTIGMLDYPASETTRLPTVCEASEQSHHDDPLQGPLCSKPSPSRRSSGHRSRSNTQGSTSSIASTDTSTGASQSQSSYIDFDSASSVGSCDGAIETHLVPTPVLSVNASSYLQQDEQIGGISMAHTVDNSSARSAEPAQPRNSGLILRDRTCGQEEPAPILGTDEGGRAAGRRRPSKLVKPSRYFSRAVAPLALGPTRTLPLLHRGFSAGSQDAATPTLSSPYSAMPGASSGMDEDADEDIATPLDEIDPLPMTAKDDNQENSHRPEHMHSRSLSWTRFKARFR